MTQHKSKSLQNTNFPPFCLSISIRKCNGERCVGSDREFLPLLRHRSAIIYIRLCKVNKEGWAMKKGLLILISYFFRKARTGLKTHAGPGRFVVEKTVWIIPKHM